LDDLDSSSCPGVDCELTLTKQRYPGTSMRLQQKEKVNKTASANTNSQRTKVNFLRKISSDDISEQRKGIQDLHNLCNARKIPVSTGPAPHKPPPVCDAPRLANKLAANAYDRIPIAICRSMPTPTQVQL